MQIATNTHTARIVTFRMMNTTTIENDVGKTDSGVYPNRAFNMRQACR
jgi:hypothetical protein